MTDNYELLPHEELESLRMDVKRLKESPYPDSKDNETLLSSMKALTTSINKLLKVFEGAQEELIKEYADASPTKLLHQISEQNAKIAEGIIVLSKIVRKDQLSSPISGSDESAPPAAKSNDDLDSIDLNKGDKEAKKSNRKGLLGSF